MHMSAWRYESAAVYWMIMQNSQSIESRVFKPPLQATRQAKGKNKGEENFVTIRFLSNLFYIKNWRVINTYGKL